MSEIKEIYGLTGEGKPMFSKFDNPMVLEVFTQYLVYKKLYQKYEKDPDNWKIIDERAHRLAQNLDILFDEILELQIQKR